jgi:radical SAM protein with 4Fe4S-binding SPASM domain
MESLLKELNFFLYFTSLDGMPEYHDEIRGRKNAFIRAMQGLDLFTRMKVPVRMINTVVHPGNISQLEKMVHIVKNSRATSWRLSPVSNAGRAAGEKGYELSGEQLRYLADFVERRRKDVPVEFGHAHVYLGNFAGHIVGKPFFCGAGLTRCTIMQDGEVVGCHQIFDEKFSEGNIRDSSFPHIWKNGFTRFREKTFHESCIGCAHLEVCRGGCWAEMEKRGSCLKSTWNEGK